MNTIYIFKLFLVLVCFSVVKCANILALFPSPGYSQYILAEPLFIALAERGHNITVISGFETKNVKNVNNVVVDLSNDDELPPGALFQLQDLSIFTNIMLLNDIGLVGTEKILVDKKVQELINSNQTFDLILVETFFSEALQVFSKHFEAHQVLFHSVALNEWNSHLVGNPYLPSYLPISFAGYTNHMDFNQIFRNTIVFWFDRIYKYFVQYPRQQELVKKYFPKTYNLNEIIYNASLMLTCSHVSTSGALTLTTSVVEIGGIHITSKKLPDNLQTFLNSAKDGAIFFSLGSNVQSSSLSKELIQDILAAIGKLKQKVLWKFEDDQLENKPDNLLVSKWFPQSDILAHPNTIIFITHCGMGSTTEAVYHGVPVIGIPIYGDQFMNLRMLVSFGMGIELSLKKFTGDTLKDSINKILNSSKYKENAKKRSSIMKDRPMKPLNLAVYWVEYVLRHDGAHHLKNTIMNLTWYQLYSLDIVAVLFVSLVSVILAPFVVRKCLKGRNSKRKVE